MAGFQCFIVSLIYRKPSIALIISVQFERLYLQVHYFPSKSVRTEDAIELCENQFNSFNFPRCKHFCYDRNTHSQLKYFETRFKEKMTVFHKICQIVFEFKQKCS
jgi:hypothetical protein